MRQVYKLLVILFCSAGFVYQAGAFMKIYFEYPSVVDLAIRYPDFVDTPAVTVCNYNGLRRSAYCLKNEGKCILSERGEQICQEDPSLCKNKTYMATYMVPELDYLEEELAYGTVAKLDNYGHLREDLLKECHFSWAPDFPVCSEKEVIRIIGSTLFETTTNCYVINSRVNRKPTAISRIPISSGVDQPYIRLVLDLEPHEYFQPIRKVMALVSIHSPVHYVNPYVDGFEVVPGLSYTIQLTAAQTTLLPAPFSTNCTDYSSRNATGPLTQQACLYECKKAVARSKCNCFISWAPTDRRDIGDNETICRRSDDPEECMNKVSASHCYANCARDCRFNTYTFMMDKENFENQPKTSWPDDDNYTSNMIALTRSERDAYLFPADRASQEAYSNLFTKDRYVEIWIKMRKNELMVYTQKPKYESVELFSYLGSYVGVWLGLAILEIVELFELLAVRTRKYVASKCRL